MKLENGHVSCINIKISNNFIDAKASQKDVFKNRSIIHRKRNKVHLPKF